MKVGSKKEVLRKHGACALFFLFLLTFAILSTVILSNAFALGRKPLPREVPFGVRFIKGPYLQTVKAHEARIRIETNGTSANLLWSEGTFLGNSPNSLAFKKDLKTKGGYFFEARLSALKPFTKYTYRVELLTETGSLARPSPVRTFKTSISRPGKFSFLVMGDHRTGHKAHKKVIERIKEFSKGAGVIRPDFILDTGDLVDRPVYNDWNIFFDIESALLGEFPLWPAIGNHEMVIPRKGNRFRDIFSLPGKEIYYHFEHRGAHFIALNGNSLLLRTIPGIQKITKQRKWLEKTLKKIQGTGPIFSFIHQPLYSSGKHGSDKFLRKAFEPLFIKYGVDFVFQGHDHNYERVKLVSGIQYIVTGGGGANLRKVKKQQDFSLVVNDTDYHFIYVEVEGSKAHLQVVDVNGNTFDTFTNHDTSKNDQGNLIPLNSTTTSN